MGFFVESGCVSNGLVGFLFCSFKVFVVMTLVLDLHRLRFLNCRIVLKRKNKGKKMRTKNKHRKSTSLPCNAGSRCSWPIVVCSLVGCFVLLHLYSLTGQKDLQIRETQIYVRHHERLQELEKVEEVNIQLPPPRRRSARAAKRKPKRPTTMIDEFLDENSQIRHIFFPGLKRAVDPRKDSNNDTYYYYPGRIWLDTEGNPIQAHGGGILYDDKTKMYYWYGEYKDGATYHAHKKGAARVSFA